MKENPQSQPEKSDKEARLSTENVKAIKPLKRASVLGRTITGGLSGAAVGAVVGFGADKLNFLQPLMKGLEFIAGLFVNNPQTEDVARVTGQAMDKITPSALVSSADEAATKRGQIAFISIVSAAVGAFSGFQSARNQNARAEDSEKWSMVERGQRLADARWHETKSFQQRVEEKLGSIPAASQTR